MLLDRFGQSNKFQKKKKKKFRDIQQMTPHRPYDVFSRSFRGRPENVLRTSWGHPESTSLGHQIRASPGRHCEMSPGRHIGTSPGWSNKIFKGCPGDVGGGHPRDVTGTNICRLGIC